ncbi:unnamed protein product [Dicrocoelium dendriticum]|nr:unnamed protein product [Dicrocoelium dendriticum]
MPPFTFPPSVHVATDTNIVDYNQLPEFKFLNLDAAALHLSALPEEFVTSETDNAVFSDELNVAIASPNEEDTIPSVQPGAQPTAAVYDARREPQNATVGE